MEQKDIFKQMAEEAVAKQRKAAKNFVVRIIPTILWCAASVFTAVNAFNDGEGFYIATGIISSIGAVVMAVKVYKETNKQNEK